MHVLAAATANSGLSIGAWAAALGAIGGAIVSGIVAITLAIIQRKSLDDQARRQRHSQQDQFRAEVERDHATWQLEQRRATYVGYVTSVEKFLQAATETDKALRGLRSKRDGVSNTEIGQINDLLATLERSYDEAYPAAQLVRLAGPPSMVHRIRGAVQLMSELRISAVQGAKFEGARVDADGDGALAALVGDLRLHIEDFLSAAATVLGSIDAR